MVVAESFFKEINTNTTTTTTAAVVVAATFGFAGLLVFVGFSG